MIEHESQIGHEGDNGNEKKQVVSHTIHDSQIVKRVVLVNKGMTGINTISFKILKHDSRTVNGGVVGSR